MRKFLWVAVLCMAMLSVSTEARAVDLDAKLDVLSESLWKLADKIVQNNKHTFEAKLTKKERDLGDEIHGEGGFSNTLWNRVWAKDKTLVIGSAGSNKKFYAHHIETRDTEWVFAGGIRVGANTQILEKFFNVPLTQLSKKPGQVELAPEAADFGPIVHIFYTNGKITQLTYFLFDGIEGTPTSAKTDAFVEAKRKELGLKDATEDVTNHGSGNTIRGMRVNLRSRPSTKSKVITQLNEGDPIEVTGTNVESDGTWCRVRTSNGREGWVFGKYVQ